MIGSRPSLTPMVRMIIALGKYLGFTDFYERYVDRYNRNSLCILIAAYRKLMVRGFKNLLNLKSHSHLKKILINLFSEIGIQNRRK